MNPTPKSIEECRPIGDNISISAIQDFLATIYGSKNSHLDDDYIFSFITEKSGILARATTKARKFGEKFVPTPEVLIRPLSWLFALASKHKISVETAFINKYPGICPHCLEARCVCSSTNQTPKDPRYLNTSSAIKHELSIHAGKYLHSPGKKITLERAQSILAEIYPANFADWQTRPEIIFSKILEELAELREATRKYEQKQAKIASIEEELADIFAWLIGIWTLLYHKEDTKQPGLTSSFLDYYWEGCPVCGAFPCDCAKGSDRFYTIISNSEWDRLKELLTELNRKCVGTDCEIVTSNLLLSLNATVSDPRGTLVKGYFRELVSEMRKTSTLGTPPSEAKTLAERILKQVESLQLGMLIDRKDIGGPDPKER